MIYFAHSKRIYDTPEETNVLEFLSEKWGRREICCPNKDMGELGSMTPYLKRVSVSKKVVVREYKGYIGKGAYNEVKEALKLNIPVMVIRGNGLLMEMLPVIGVEVNDPTDWKVRYAELIV